MKRVLLASLTLALAACAKPPSFTKPAFVSDLEFDTDVMECNLIAKGLAPMTGGPVPPTLPQPAPQGGAVGGFATGFASGIQQGAYYAQLAQLAKAWKEQEHAMVTCMRQRGYVLEK